MSKPNLLKYQATNILKLHPTTEMLVCIVLLLHFEALEVTTTGLNITNINIIPSMMECLKNIYPRNAIGTLQFQKYLLWSHSHSKHPIIFRI